ncbi:MAG: hypothetical protein II957_00200 [Treponema sp.]|nr:hypothetical protein [Treponema sp.]
MKYIAEENQRHIIFTGREAGLSSVKKNIPVSLICPIGFPHITLTEKGFRLSAAKTVGTTAATLTTTQNFSPKLELGCLRINNNIPPPWIIVIKHYKNIAFICRFPVLFFLQQEKKWNLHLTRQQAKT